MWYLYSCKKLKEEVTDAKINLSSKFEFEPQNDFKTLLIIYWLPKTWSEGRIIAASRKCRRKTFSNAVTKAFELIFKQIQSSKI